MAKLNEVDALENVVEILRAENESLKNGLVVSVAGLQQEQVQQGINIADHETRITTLEAP